MIASPAAQVCHHARARLLLVDDETQNLVLLRRLLHNAGYECIEDTNDSSKVLALYEDFQPDLICLDLNMPGLSGFDLLRQLSDVIPSDSYIPIIMLTGDSTPGTLQSALSLGATDFVMKPFSADEVRLRIRNLLEPRFMHLRLQEQNALLERRVRDRTRALDDSRLEVLERLARAAEFRDDDTGQHIRRVGRIAEQLAQLLGLPAGDVELIARTAPLHDVGKIGIPDGVLLKEGRLTPVEFELMKTHTVIGAEILGGGGTPLVQMAQSIALHHHERWNGSGYPHGLRGTDIPLAARIVGLADFFDALTHERTYRAAWSIPEVLREIEAQSGAHFDPALVSAFKRMPHEQLI
jgi:putative two-component system response regulator